MVDDKLEYINEKEYAYYHNLSFPLYIEISETEEAIEITITRYFKGIVNRQFTKKSRKVGKMTKEQKEDYILDIIDIFLKNKRGETILK